MTTDTTCWRKSSRSASGPQCVECAVGRDGTRVRDSKYPEGGQLAVLPATWAQFMDAVRQSAE